MELKPGYKETDVGVIPEDWGTKLLPEVAWFQEGPGLRNWQFTRTGMKVINVTNLENGVLNLDRTDRHISIPLFSRMYQHFAIDANDIVMASSGNSYSKTAVVREQDLPLVMNTSVIRFKPQKLYDYGFLWAILNAPLFKNQIDLMITGGAQPNFGPYHLKRINVPVPPLPEQRAIATALSDVDALLDGLDRLIAKKRDLKQAAMQQLLTGETRLPGFEGEWEAKRLGEIAEIIMGQSPSSSNYNSRGDGLPLIQGNADIVDRKTIKRIFTTQITKRGREGDVLMSVRAPVGEISRALFDVCLGRGVCALRFPNDFLYHYLIFLEPSWAKHSKGSTFDSVNSADVKAVEIKMPLDATEQEAIATVLSDMDAEIAALEQRRNKTKNIKQAMMQELLTGKTRLVTPGGSNA